MCHAQDNFNAFHLLSINLITVCFHLFAVRDITSSVLQSPLIDSTRSESCFATYFPLLMWKHWHNVPQGMLNSTYDSWLYIVLHCVSSLGSPQFRPCILYTGYNCLAYLYFDAFALMPRMQGVPGSNPGGICFFPASLHLTFLSFSFFLAARYYCVMCFLFAEVPGYPAGLSPLFDTLASTIAVRPNTLSPRTLASQASSVTSMYLR